MEPHEKLYYTALQFLDRDASPRDRADDEYACAESVDEVYKACFGHYIGRRITPTLSTAEMYRILEDSPDFIAVKQAEIGCIVLSPTGYGNGVLKNGHIGYCGKWQIMSNDSRNGQWGTYFNYDKWYNYYANKGGFPVLYYKPI